MRQEKMPLLKVIWRIKVDDTQHMTGFDMHFLIYFFNVLFFVLQYPFLDMYGLV